MKDSNGMQWGNDETLIDVSLFWANNRPEKVVYTFLRDGEKPESSITFSQLDSEAKRLAVALQRHANIGDRVMLLFPSGIDFIISFIGCLYAGLVAVPVNTPKPKKKHWQRLATVIDDAQVAVILSTDSNIKKNADWLANEPSFSKQTVLSTQSLLEKVSEDDWTPPGAKHDTVAFLQYTSGSTGNPKGVIVTHGNLMHNSELIRKSFHYHSDSVFVTWLPPVP